MVTDLNHEQVLRFARDSRLALLNLSIKVPSHRFRLFAARLLGRVAVDNTATSGRGVHFMTVGGIVIGARSIINSGTVLDGRGGLIIGSDVNISPSVKLWSADHDPSSPTFAGRTRLVEVRQGAWIASSSVVLPGTVIGEGSVVGAASVCRGLIPPYEIWAGNPAQKVSRRPLTEAPTLPFYRRWWQ